MLSTSCRYLLAHGVDDTVEQGGPVGLESSPLQRCPEDDQRSHRATLMEAQVHCRHEPLIKYELLRFRDVPFGVRRA